MNRFFFSQNSLNHLKGVHPGLVRLASTALATSEVDFAVIDGLRTVEEQRELVRKGASQTMKSRHLTGHAIDVAPYINGKIRWDWPYYYKLADAFIEAARQENLKIRWGGNWRFRDIRQWNSTGEDLAKAYTGGFPDGPHFEIPR